MSLCHLRLVKSREDSSDVIYRVESPDFSDSENWQEIGQLKIQKNLGNYEFSQGGALLNHKIVPPWIYGLSEEQQETQLRNQYRDHGWGAWTMRIHHYASTFLEENSYPDNHPKGFFTDVEKD